MNSSFTCNRLATMIGMIATLAWGGCDAYSDLPGSDPGQEQIDELGAFLQPVPTELSNSVLDDRIELDGDLGD